MEQLPNFGLANTSTAFDTMSCGIFALLFCHFVHKQPFRWVFTYWMIVITGVFTITLHGFGETNPVWGERWFWSFLDTGSNIVVTWAVSLAILGDYYSAKTRHWAVPVSTLAMIIGLGWHYYDRLPSTGRWYIIPLGKWGGFYPGEFCLILFAIACVALFFAKWNNVPMRARPLLLIVTFIFLMGLLLATASNDKIAYPFLSLHAIWHVVGAYGFLTLWAFNHVRFNEIERPLESA